MNAQHTPGPWAISKSGATSPKASYVYSTGKATGCVCFIYPEHEDAEANAHLIAAAPDLLEACEAALLCEDIADSEIGDQIRAAIAKAEGGDS